jgi:hypothetical protein
MLWNRRIVKLRKPFCTHNSLDVILLFTKRSTSMGEIDRRPDSICHDALMGNKGVCFDDCTGRLAYFMIGQTVREEGVAVDVCPRKSKAGSGHGGRGDYCNNGPDPMVIYRDTVPTLAEVEAVVADAW